MTHRRECRPCDYRGAEKRRLNHGVIKTELALEHRMSQDLETFRFINQKGCAAQKSLSKYEVCMFCVAFCRLLAI